VAVSFCGLTDPGKVRGRNEDHFLIARLSKAMRICATSLPSDGQAPLSEEEGYLVVVADGMGGAAAGERASALAVESVEAFVQNTLKWFLHFGGREERVLHDELRESLQRADRTLFERAQSNPALFGMGTTLTMAYSVANDVYIVHAGDSRAYLFRDGQLEQVTADHTLVQAMVDAGMISAEEARHHHRRHVVTNVLGGPSEGVYAEIHKLEVRDGDVLLFCSDGLTEPLPDDDITAILADHATIPQDAAHELLRRALDAGGPDNVTVIVARYQVDG
jgi:protein phosphatase